MSQARRLSSSELIDWYAAGKSHPEGDFFEEIIEGTYRQILQQGDSALDCGAHRGRHTFAMLEAVGSSGYVVGAEALPMLAASLSFELANREKLNCTIFPMAIGEKAGIQSFQWVREAEAYSGLLQRDLPTGADKSVFPIEVPVFTLDTLAAFLPRPVRFMKMDLEGGEFHALQGGRQMLSLCRCFSTISVTRFTISLAGRSDRNSGSRHKCHGMYLPSRRARMTNDMFNINTRYSSDESTDNGFPPVSLASRLPQMRVLYPQTYLDLQMQRTH
jgi:FkbM family methyltransferase